MQRWINGIVFCSVATFFFSLSGSSTAYGQQSCEDTSLQGALNGLTCVANGCYYDEKEATAEGTGLTCTTEPKPCLDLSDQQNDPSIKGTVYGLTEHAYSQKGRIASYDYCDGNNLLQVKCGANNFVAYDETTCADGCNDGTCITVPQQPACTDSDLGMTSNLKGTVRFRDGRELTDYCQDSSLLTEFSCVSSDDPINFKSQNITCEYGCSNGACQTVPQRSCTDSDGGKDPYKKGTVIYKAPGIYDVDDDTCVNTTLLGEQYCSNGVAATEMLSCAAGCSNGACLPENPTTGFRNATWECYDGTRSEQGGPTSCKTSETWQQYAKESCSNHCYSDGSKCGVNSFSVSNECNGDDQEGTPEIRRIFLTVEPKSQWSDSETRDKNGNVIERRTDPSFRLWIDVRLPDGSKPQGNENLVVRQYLSENPADMTGGGNIAQYRYDGDGELYYGYGIGVLSESMPYTQYLRVIAEYNGQKVQREAILTFQLPTPSVCDGCAIPTNPIVPPVRPPQGDWLYDTGRGGERVHKMTYAQYTSEGIFTPSKNMHVTAIRPDVWYCNGLCKMNIEIYDAVSNLLLASSSQQGSSIDAFTGQLSNSVKLKKNMKYRIKMSTSTTMSVGISTAGRYTPNANGYGSFAIESATSDSSDHLDRGTISFKLLEKGSSVVPPTPVEPPVIIPNPSIPSSDALLGTPGTYHLRENIHQATIIMIEYADFECPYCARHQKTLKDIMDAFAGDVNWEYRHFPLDFHKNAANAARASECVATMAGTDAFWDFADKLYEQGSSKASILKIAQGMGISVSDLIDCSENDPSVRKVIDNHIGYGKNFGVSGTPTTFLVNTKTHTVKVITGAQSYDTVKAAIVELLEGDGDDDLPVPVTPPAGFEDEVETNTGRNWFSDVTNDSDIGRAANTLAEMGIVGGYPDGEFKADKPVNRAEAAKFISLAVGANIENTYTNGGFWDVIPGEWYAKYVVAAAKLGIINGNPDGSFRPADGVNTAEFLAMLSRAFMDFGAYGTQTYSDVPADAWFVQYADLAYSLQLFPDRGNLLMPARQLTRGEVIFALYRIMEKTGRANK